MKVNDESKYRKFNVIYGIFISYISYIIYKLRILFFVLFKII